MLGNWSATHHTVKAPTSISNVGKIVASLLSPGWLSKLWNANWDLSRLLVHGLGLFNVFGVTNDMSLLVSHHI